MSRLERARRKLKSRYRESLAREAAQLIALEGDWPSMLAAVHRIKGSGGSFGFPTITAAALALEQADAAERCAALEALIVQLRYWHKALPEANAVQIS